MVALFIANAYKQQQGGLDAIGSVMFNGVKPSAFNTGIKIILGAIFRHKKTRLTAGFFMPENLFFDLSQP